LWSKVSKGLQTRNIDYATYEKTAIEENQRQLLRDRESASLPWESRFFVSAEDGNWNLNIGRPLPQNANECYDALKERIFSRSKQKFHEVFWRK
jgi:hypothetical protein